MPDARWNVKVVTRGRINTENSVLYNETRYIKDSGNGQECMMIIRSASKCQLGSTSPIVVRIEYKEQVYPAPIVRGVLTKRESNECHAMQPAPKESDE